MIGRNEQAVSAHQGRSRQPKEGERERYRHGIVLRMRESAARSNVSQRLAGGLIELDDAGAAIFRGKFARVILGFSFSPASRRACRPTGLLSGTTKPRAGRGLRRRNT